MSSVNKNDKTPLDKAIAQIKRKPIDCGNLDNLNDRVFNYTAGGAESRNFKHIAAQIARYAAVLVVCASLLGYGYFTTAGSGENLAWGAVVKRVSNIDCIHIYQYDYLNGALHSSRQGWAWYSGGKICFIDQDGTITVDDGVVKNYYDSEGELLKQKKTEFGRIDKFSEGRNDIFNMLVKGVFGYNDKQISRTMPSEIEQDFIVYKFEAAAKPVDFIKSVSVLVGKGSALPFQVKVETTLSEGTYSLIILDYQQKSMPRKIKELIGYKNDNALPSK